MSVTYDTNDSLVEAVLTSLCASPRFVVSEPYNYTASASAKVVTPTGWFVPEPATTTPPLGPLVSLRQMLAEFSPQLPSHLRSPFAKQFEFLCDAYDSEVEHINPPNESSFNVLLRFLAAQSPSHCPSISLASDGKLIASWFNTPVGKVTFEFHADGSVEFFHLENGDRGLQLKSHKIAEPERAPVALEI